MGWFSKLEHSVSSSFSKLGHSIEHGAKYIAHEVKDHPIESAVIGVTGAAALVAAPFTGGTSLAAEGELVGAEVGGSTLAASLADVDATLAAGAEASEVAGEAAEVGQAGLEDADAMEARFAELENNPNVRTVEAEDEFADAETFEDSDLFEEPSMEQPVADRINELGDTYLRPALENPGQAALDAVRGTARLTAQGVTKVAPTIARVGAQVEEAATQGISEATGLSQNAVRAAGFLSTGTGRAIVGTGLATLAGGAGFGTKIAIDEANKSDTDKNLKQIQDELKKMEEQNKKRKKKRKANPTFASKI